MNSLKSKDNRKGAGYNWVLGLYRLSINCSVPGSVGDPDPHVFGPPGSGSFPFLIKGLSGLKLCLPNKIFNTKLYQKLKFLGLKIMDLWVTYWKKYEKNYLFCILKVTEERSRTRGWIRIHNKNVTDPQHWFQVFRKYNQNFSHPVLSKPMV